MQTQYSTITISLPRFKLSNIQKGVYLYEINIATRWNKWHLQKKYTQFQQLNNSLAKQFNNIPQFPIRYLNFILGESQQDRQENRQNIQQYLKQISLRPDIINSDCFSQFLQIQKHSPLLLAKRPKLIGQFQLDQRINDQGKIITQFYCHPNYQFFILTTGNNSPLQKFNSIIANTKFPWQDQQDAQFVLPLGTVQCWIKKKQGFGYQRLWARNYPVQAVKLLFSPSAQLMVVGLDDGAIQIFKLHPRGNYYYYQVIRLMNVHQDQITGLYLDQINRVLYTTALDGWLNIIDPKKAVLIDTIQFTVDITALYGDYQNSRLFIALGQGNIDIYQYDHRAKIKYIHSLSTAQTGPIKALSFDYTKNYFFAGGYDSGNIWIFEIGKPKHEKISKQIACLNSKQRMKSMIWISQKMQLITSSQTGQVFFWDALKGKQIYMLKAFDKVLLSKIQFFWNQNTLITASLGKFIKFWEIPRIWRDQIAQNQQQRQIQIRRKVQNLYKVRQAIKKKNNDSDQDDLRYWHLEDSDDQYI